MGVKKNILCGMIKRIIIFIFVLTSLCFSNSFNFKKNVLVTKIIDGDTIIVSDDDGATLTIRLFGIDAPEYSKNNKSKTQPFGYEAYSFLEDKILNKKVKVTVVDGGGFTRIAGIISYYGENINEIMLSRGYAHFYEKAVLDLGNSKKNNFTNKEAWQNIENEAIKNKVGLWSLDNVITPWDFRNSLKKK